MTEVDIASMEPQVLEQDPRDVRIAELEEQLARATPPAKLREFAERMQARNAELEPLRAETTSCGVSSGWPTPVSTLSRCLARPSSPRRRPTESPVPNRWQPSRASCVPS